MRGDLKVRSGPKNGTFGLAVGLLESVYRASKQELGLRQAEDQVPFPFSALATISILKERSKH